jgi:hypothetical protein
MLDATTGNLVARILNQTEAVPDNNDETAAPPIATLGELVVDNIDIYSFLLLGFDLGPFIESTLEDLLLSFIAT